MNFLTRESFLKTCLQAFLVECARAGSVIVAVALIAEWLIPGSVLPFFPLFPLILLVTLLHICVSPFSADASRSATHLLRWLWLILGLALSIVLFLLTRELGTTARLLAGVSAALCFALVYVTVRRRDG